jgi:GH43 family beta-xylosidase
MKRRTGNTGTEGWQKRSNRGSLRAGSVLRMAGLVMLGVISSGVSRAQTAVTHRPTPGHPTATEFVNPLLPSGADPWVTSKDGFYYYMNTTGKSLEIWKTRDMAELATAEHKVVWLPPATGPYSREIWAPELHFLDGRWYIYFAADDGENADHRIYVVENSSPDPLQGRWVLKGKVADRTDRWAIDPTVFEEHGKMYLLWSGWQGATNGEQRIYIARLRNPWTIEGDRVELSSPEYPWEMVGDLPSVNKILVIPHVSVNEGPEILQHENKVFLTYSGSGCWTNYYELGMLWAESSADPLKRSSWHKLDHSVFWQSAEADAYGTGHNSFFVSPDGKQWWLVYHANSGPGEGCGDRRSPRMQPFLWKSDGMPDFGRPVPLSTPIERPSDGESNKR